MATRAVRSRQDAAAILGVSRRDDALVAWVATRATNDGTRELHESGGLADDISAEDSADSFFESIDAVFERDFVEL
jgi:hypothetical protein